MSTTLAQLSQVLALIHEAAVAPERWTEALAALSCLCESSKGSILDIDAASGRVMSVAQIGHDPAAQEEYVEHYYALDPTLQTALAAPPHRALTVYERFSSTERARSEYFRYMARYDVGDVVGVTTKGSAGTRSTLSLQRPLKAAGYEDATKRLLALIVPHLEVAKRVQARVAEAIAERNALAAGLDRLADPTFIVDAAQTIRFANAAAHRLFAADPRVRGRSGKLSFAATRLQSAFEAAVRAATVTMARSQTLPLPLPAAGGASAAEITVCPLRADHTFVGPWQEPLVLVIVSLPPQDTAAIAARMRALYGLTPAEARLVARLALGASVDEIALDTGVRASTLRSQLKSIRAKTGVSRQADLVRLALGGTPLL